MTEIKTYKDLRVYQCSMKLLEEVYDIAYKIPYYKLRTQLNNSAEAIPALIGEGFARKRKSQHIH